MLSSSDCKIDSNPFMDVINADKARRARLRRRIGVALARLKRQANQPAAARSAAELLAACALLAADDERTLAELEAAVRLGAKAKDTHEMDVARQSYLLLLVDAANEPRALSERRSLMNAVTPISAVSGPNSTFWAAAQALNGALTHGDRPNVLRAALRVAKAWSSPAFC